MSFEGSYELLTRNLTEDDDATFRWGRVCVPLHLSVNRVTQGQRIVAYGQANLLANAPRMVPSVCF